jgi:hypothetical protein
VALEQAVERLHDENAHNSFGEYGDDLELLINAAPALLTAAREREELRRIFRVTGQVLTDEMGDVTKLRAEVLALTTERDALLEKLDDLELELLEANNRD